MATKDGILSIDYLLKSQINQTPLFVDCFKTTIKGVSGKSHDVPFILRVDINGQFSLEVEDNQVDRSDLVYSDCFEINCSGCNTKRKLFCKEALVSFDTKEAVSEFNSFKSHKERALPRMLIKPISSVILEKQNENEDDDRLVRLYMTDVDRFSVPDDSDAENSIISLGDVGCLFFRGRFHMPEPMNIPVISIIKGNNKIISDDMWLKEANHLLNMLVDIITFIQGGKIPIPIVETVLGGKIRTKLIHSGMGSESKFMPAIKNQKYASKLIRSAFNKNLNKNPNKDQWLRIKRAIDFSVSVQKFSDIGLLSKIVAVESIVKSYPEVIKQTKLNKNNNIRKAIKFFMKSSVDTNKRQNLFKDNLFKLSECKKGDLFDIRNKLAHLCGFRDDDGGDNQTTAKRSYNNDEIAKSTADSHDIFVRLVLSFLGFDGVFCRYNMRDGCYGMTELKKNWEALEVDDNWLNKFDKNRWIGIFYRQNGNDWRSAVDAFKNSQKVEFDCCCSLQKSNIDDNQSNS